MITTFLQAEAFAAQGRRSVGSVLLITVYEVPVFLQTLLPRQRRYSGWPVFLMSDASELVVSWFRLEWAVGQG